MKKITVDNERQLTISSEELVEYDNVDINDEEIETDVHMVSEHIRNLPEGWQASIDKINTAEDHGYTLNPGQTWVESYQKGGFVA